MGNNKADLFASTSMRLTEALEKHGRIIPAGGLATNKKRLESTDKVISLLGEMLDLASSEHEWKTAATQAASLKRSGFTKRVTVLLGELPPEKMKYIRDAWDETNAERKKVVKKTKGKERDRSLGWGIPNDPKKKAKKQKEKIRF